MRENGSSLDFNLSRYQVLWQMRTGFYQHVICCTVYLQKMVPCIIETLVNGKFMETFAVLFFACLDCLLAIFIYSFLNCEHSCSQVTPSLLV